MKKLRVFLILYIISGFFVYVLFAVAEYNNHKIEMSAFENSDDLILACEEFYLNENYVNVENCKPYFQKENHVGNYTCGVEICSSEKMDLNDLFNKGDLALEDDNYTYKKLGYSVEGKLFNLNVYGTNILIVEYSLNDKNFYVLMASDIKSEYLRTKYFIS